MEEFKKKNGTDVNDKEIIFSQSIKAGKRIYYLDVKKNRKDEMFLAITESKKIVTGEDDQQVSFEKHKIFLYREDFEKFINGLMQAVHYIENEQGPYVKPAYKEKSEEEEAPSHTTEGSFSSSTEEEIKLDIDFWGKNIWKLQNKAYLCAAFLQHSTGNRIVWWWIKQQTT